MQTYAYVIGAYSHIRNPIHVCRTRNAYIQNVWAGLLHTYVYICASLPYIHTHILPIHTLHSVWNAYAKHTCELCVYTYVNILVNIRAELYAYIHKHMIENIHRNYMCMYGTHYGVCLTHILYEYVWIHTYTYCRKIIHTYTYNFIHTYTYNFIQICAYNFIQICAYIHTENFYYIMHIHIQTYVVRFS